MIRRRIAPLAVVGLVVATIVTTASASSAETTTTSEPCGDSVMQGPEGVAAALVEAAEPTGRYQAGAARGSDHTVSYVVLWQDGTPQIVANDNETLDVTDVNEHGDIVGSHGRGGVRAWRYRNGSRVDLPTLNSGWETRAIAINGAGTIAGTTTNPETYAVLPIVWLAYNVVGRLPVPSGFDGAYVSGIDTDGTVAGTVYQGDGYMPTATQPIVWFTDGSYRLLPGVEDGQAALIGGGTVLGSGNTSSGTRVVSWNARSGEATLLSPDYTTAVTMNSLGDFVAQLANGGGWYGLVKDGVVRPLSGTPNRVVGLTDTNTAYGWQADFSLRWTCAA